MTEDDHASVGVVVQADTLLDAPDSEYRDTPGGWRLHKSCIFEAPNGAEIDDRSGVVTLAGKVVGERPKCRYKRKFRAGSAPPPSVPPPGAPIIYEASSSATAASGVFCSAFAYCKPWYNWLHTDTVVPLLPSDTGTSTNPVNYIWSGLNSTDGETLLQPVLTSGVNDYGSIAWWLSIWLCNYDQPQPDGYTCTKNAGNLGVSEGDTIWFDTWVDYTDRGANCDYNTGNRCNWWVRAYDTTSGYYTQFRYVDVHMDPTHTNKMNRAWRAVDESYQLANCYQFPAGNPIKHNSSAYQPYPSTGYNFNLVQQTWSDVKQNGPGSLACNVYTGASDPSYTWMFFH